MATANFLAEMYPDSKNIHGYSFKTKDVGIFGAGGADLGMTNIGDKEMFSTLKKAYEGIKGMKKKIMLTHMHPEGSASEFSGFPGSKGIRKAIELFKPDILIHSHIHEAEGIEDIIGNTKVINVGRKGRIIEL